MTTAPLVAAACRVRSSFEPPAVAPNRRLNSPSCGVSDDGRLARLDGAEQGLRRGPGLGPAHHEAEARRPHGRLALVRRERGQRVGIEDGRRGRREHRQHGRRSAGADAGARPDQHGVAALIGQELGQRGIGADRLDHDGREVRGVDGRCRRRPDDGDEARADAQRAARAHAGRTRALRRSGHHDGVAARVLVPVDAGQWVMLAPQRRPVGERARADLLRAPGRGCRCRPDAPRRTERAPAAADARASAERTSPCRSPAPPARRWRPCVPSRPLGTSTATTGLPVALMAATTSAARPSSGRDRPAPNRASMMRSASASVAVASGSTGSPQRCAMAAASPLSALRLPSSPRRTRYPCARRSLAATKPSPPLLPGPQTTAIAAPGPRHERGSGLGHGAAGILHQREPRHAQRHGQGIGTAHLLRCQQLVGQGSSFPRHIMRRAPRARQLGQTAENRAARSRSSIRRFFVHTPNLRANSRLALGACCPVDTQQSYVALGILCRANLGMRRA